MIRTFALVALIAASAGVQAQNLEGALKKIRDSKTIAIAYRTDAFPFSFEENKQPAGYTVELCKRIVTSIAEQLKAPSLRVKWVPATSQNRMELVRNRQAHMECGSTTATLSRMELVDFSSPVFLDTTGILARKASGASSVASLAGKKVGVVGGTTNQRALEAALKRAAVAATVVSVKNREEGLAALQSGSLDAFAGDKILLVGLAGKFTDPTQYALLDEDLGFEPYAIVLPRGDASFRLAVNRALSRIYAGDAIGEIFRNAFGAGLTPSPALNVMYGLASFPE